MNRILLKIAVLLLAIIPMETGFVVQPILGEVAKSFPNASPAIIGYVMTLPAIFTIIFSVISGRLSITMNKKTLLLVGLLFYLIGGICPAIYAGQLWFILACRGLLGIGNGLCMPLVQGLVAEFFEGQERASMMGYSNAVGALGGILTAFFAGYIALFNWRYSFLLYGFMVIVFVLGWIALPDIKPAGKSEENLSAREKWRLPGGVYIIALFGFILWTFQLMSGIGTSLFATSEKIGNAAQIGTAMSLNMIAAFLSSLLFGQVFKKLKLNIWVLAIAMFAVSSLLTANAHIMITIYLAMAINGIGTAFLLPGFYVRASSIAAKTHQTFALGIVNAAMNLGVFTSSAVMGLIFSLLGGPNFRSLFVVITGIQVIMLILVAIYVFVTQNKEKGIEKTVAA
ncbi:MFS transporter [Moorella sulfitireducens]|uniref:MFS transporter n=1 Tax=Neomoorella sulfitireducens TaxID=2972948 RepID=UPI0021AD45AA|nr:MFS transporter [Moorella sulfitireducens]